ncbi:hypothetical protein [Candidatus Spongiihabitans sp.]|uniref:hypothetical protein n=1 Tax=Candidatus Spongiihabitans sp. TaxID=3101308 RepID=UPI003C6F404F
MEKRSRLQFERLIEGAPVLANGSRGHQVYLTALWPNCAHLRYNPCSAWAQHGIVALRGSVFSSPRRVKEMKKHIHRCTI